MRRIHSGHLMVAVTAGGVFRNLAVWLPALFGALWISALHARPAEAAAKESQAVSAETAKTPSSLPRAVREEVAARLDQIKPKDTEDFVYRIKVADPSEELPGDLRLDLVYKIGHYRWSLIALRFERREGRTEVDVSEVRYGSAFAFLKDFMRSAEETSSDNDDLPQSNGTDSPGDVLDYRDFARVRRAQFPSAYSTISCGAV